MADQWYGGQHSSGERWNVNMPAVVGVVFVVLVGVVIWVITSSGDDGDAIQSIDTTETTPATVPAVSTTPPTTTPPPMPSTTAPLTAPVAPTAAVTQPTAAPTPAPTAAPPPAPTQPPPPASEPPPATAPAPTPTSPSSDGDLGVPGHPISQPRCDGSYITVIASAVGNDASGPGIATILEEHDGASYLRTDRTCPSLTQAVDGEPIYVVYFGPFPTDGEACAAIDRGPQGAYVRRLSNDLDPTHSVSCR